MKQTTAIVAVDGDNFHGMLKDACIPENNIHHARLLAFLCVISEIDAKSALPLYFQSTSRGTEDYQNRARTTWKRYLEECGWITFMRKIKKSDNSGAPRGLPDEVIMKEIAKHLPPASENPVQTLVLVTGDGDFQCLVDLAREHGVRVVVVSRSQNLNYWLAHRADLVVRIEDYIVQFMRR